MVECGYSVKNSLNKFRIHRKEWNDLERRSPCKYLSDIGVDLDTLNFALELDCEEFRQGCCDPFLSTSSRVQGDGGGILGTGAAR